MEFSGSGLEGGDRTADSEEKTAGYVLNLVLNYKVENVYWFFGALFACYLAIPVFSLLTKNRKILWYAAALNFIFLSCLPVLKVWLGFSWSLDIPVTGSLILYVLLGYPFGTGGAEEKPEDRNLSVGYIRFSAAICLYVYHVC